MSTADGKVVRRLIASGFSELALLRVCDLCNGAGTLTDRSSAAAQLNSGLPVEAMPHSVKCPNCVSGWLFKKLNVGDLLDWLLEELQSYVEDNPKVFLEAVVSSTEAVMTENASLTAQNATK